MTPTRKDLEELLLIIDDLAVQTAKVRDHLAKFDSAQQVQGISDDQRVIAKKTVRGTRVCRLNKRA